jgi:hypothetical protein
MSEQLKLFETSNKIWVQRLWESVGQDCRGEAIEVLAQMARALLQAEAIANSKARKENSDES